MLGGSVAKPLSHADNLCISCAALQPVDDLKRYCKAMAAEILRFEKKF